MKQVFSINIAGTDVEVETPDRDNIVYIAGADTYLGMHLCKHFFEHKVSVYGCGKSDPGAVSKYCKYQKAPFAEYDIPQKKYSWLIFCHDPHKGYDKHIEAVRAFCSSLKNIPGILRVVYPSSVVVCSRERGAIQENDRLVPHNDLEMAMISGENWLQTYSYELQGKLVPYIFRFCDLYGSEFDEVRGTGLINRILNNAIVQKNLSISGVGNLNCSTCHISDACESLIAVLNTPIPPKCLNIPGERYKLIDIISMVADKFGIDVAMDCGKIWGDDFSRYGGHRNASSRFFSSVVNYVPQYKFKTWLQSNSYGNEF